VPRCTAGASDAVPSGCRSSIDRGVVVYLRDENGYAPSHERVTHTRIAERLAELKGFAFAGECAMAHRPPGRTYFVPSQTLVGIATARALGIRDEHDLFGGIVPYAFVATKAITHPLVAPDAYAPTGWCPEFAARTDDAVLLGYTVFTREDARRAGARLLAQGPVRIKPVRATGGRGQSVVRRPDELNDALAAMNEAELAGNGLVLEEDLADVATYSVGQVRVADLVATYVGTQRLTRARGGAAVYGGSDLRVVRGDFADLLARDIPHEARLAIAQARAYDAAATACFPGFFASRRNYDVAQGVNAGGMRRSGVLEQSWRIGGASGAELGALEAFQADPRLHAVRATWTELYGENDAVPPRATVYFRGVDERVGFITKYAEVETHDDTR
jgi:hypothetical protein